MATTGFTPAQTATILYRDGHKCAMCGHRATTANHRANRGSGGFRGANKISNGCAICDRCNGEIESDPVQQTRAILRGVKISRYADPTVEQYLSPLYGVNVLLDDEGGFQFAP